MNETSLLLVEDDPDIRALLKLLLECEGFEVITAGDGAEALSLLARREVDVVVTDLMMPQVDGIELIHRIRATSELAALPVIALTAYDRLINVAERAGAVRVLRKPYDLDRLAEAIEGVFDGASDEEAA